MAWSFNNLPYGWKIATGITLSAITIFVADNVRQRINQVDEIELDLAIAERCMALQYSTNPVSYYVAPPQYVRSWYSNSYETQVVAGVTSVVAVLYTNVFTNAVGYRTDHAKAVARDATIKALIPYYCDPDTVYDGTTNIVMLTVTGLWASLQIGDKTNLFTREPEWVEIVGTNIITNAATYGDLPWRIYKEDLEERYKVLNALKILSTTFRTDLSYGFSPTNVSGFCTLGWLSTKDWPTAVSNIQEKFKTGDGTYWTNTPYCIDFHFGSDSAWSGYYWDYLIPDMWALTTSWPNQLRYFNQDVISSARYGFFSVIPRPLMLGIDNDNYYKEFDSYGYGLLESQWKFFNSWEDVTTENGFLFFNPFDFDSPPSAPTVPPDLPYYGTCRGFKIERMCVIYYTDFQYCTNAYWE